MKPKTIFSYKLPDVWSPPGDIPLICGRGLDGNVSSRITVGQKNQTYHTFISPDLMASNVNSSITQ